MIKNLLKILISVLLIVIIFIGYFAYFGITTSQFNSFIKEQFNLKQGFVLSLGKMSICANHYANLRWFQSSKC